MKWLLNTLITSVIVASFTYGYAKAAPPPVLIIDDLEMQWMVDVDGHKACLNVAVVDTSSGAIEKTHVCWAVPKNYLSQRQS